MIQHRSHPQKISGEFFMGHVYSQEEFEQYNWDTARKGEPDADGRCPVFVETDEMVSQGWVVRGGNAYSSCDIDLLAMGEHEWVTMYEPDTGNYPRLND